MTKTRQRLPIICLPYGGGGASAYLRWRHLLPDFAEPVAIQLPGREERLHETPYTHIEDAVAETLRQCEQYLGGSYVVFGHSMGGLIAYELTHELIARGYSQPEALFIAAYRAPHIPLQRKPVSARSDAEFLEHIAWLEGKTPDWFADRELVEMFLPALRADIMLCERYQHRERPPLTCPILVLGGTEDLEVSPPELAAWESHTRGRFSVQMFPGNHFFVRASETQVLAAVNTELERHRSASILRT